MNSTKLNSNIKFDDLNAESQSDLDEINKRIQVISQENIDRNNNIIIDMEYNREMNRMVKEGLKYFKRGQLDLFEELDATLENN